MSLHVCCVDPANLKPGAGPRGMEGIPPHPDVTVVHCQICNARHVTMAIDPGLVGMRGAGL